MIYVGQRALTDPRLGMRGMGEGLIDAGSLVTAGEQVGEKILNNVGSGLLHFLGGGDDKPAPAPTPASSSSSSAWPWVVGGGLAAAGLGYALYRRRRRRR